MNTELPTPRLRHVFRIDATLGDPIDLGAFAEGRRRIVPLTGGVVHGPELDGVVVAGVSADWQTIRSDGSSVGDIRITLRIGAAGNVNIRARALRHGPVEVLDRLARGEFVAASEYTFRADLQAETTISELGWLNDGVFVAAAGRLPDAVAYDTYLVE